MISWFMIAGGTVALTFGAELLIKGASTLATRFGISPIIIGLTVVAFGTSAPEMAVSVNAAIRGQADIAVGNVLGSNILNIMLILGATALIAPLSVHLQIIRVEVPIMIAAGVFTYFFSLSGQIDRMEGILTLGLLVVYVLFQIRNSLAENKKDSRAGGVMVSPVWQDGLRILCGLFLLVFGSDYFVQGAVTIARGFGVSELVIGLTVVSVGTSLPEIATSLMAALKKQTDIAVGNVVGSNIFNSLGVLGIAGSASPSPVQVSPQVLSFDFPLSIAVSLLCFPLFLRGLKIGRLEGFGFLIGYIAYVGFLILDQWGNPMVSGKHAQVVHFIFPLVAFLLIVYAARELIAHPRGKKT
ncbi:MAG: calcium/sodium antiporter [Bdellovibrionales bacterium]